jgi:hypothetical protein
LPELEDAEVLDFSNIIFKVIDASPEAKQFEHMFNALGKVKGEIFFNVLGASTFSSGNGAFEDIPIQDGLGFGLGASLRISKSEGRILKIQLKATIETLKKQVNLLVNEHNSLIENFDIMKQRATLAESNYQAMIDYISIGGEIDALEMIEILDNLYASKILQVSYRLRYADLVEKLKRMTFTGDYLKKRNFTKASTDIKAKDVVNYFTTIQKNLSKLNSESNLQDLKTYSDSVLKGNEYLNELVKKSSDRRRFRKYIRRIGMKNNLCQKILITESDNEDFSSECSVGRFNSCPQSFVDHKEIKVSLIKNLKVIYESEDFASTSCEAFNN